MSQKYYCDVCGTELKKTWRTVEIADAQVNKYDLCPAHSKEFDKLMRDFFAYQNLKAGR